MSEKLIPANGKERVELRFPDGVTIDLGRFVETVALESMDQMATAMGRTLMPGEMEAEKRAILDRALTVGRLEAERLHG